jgi:hypothetical protein
MASTASELTWIKYVLTDLNFEIKEPMKIFCDNQSARHIAINLVFHERTKHIEVDCHYIRENFQSKEINNPFVKSEDQLTDIFTKGLRVKAYEDILCNLGLFDLYNLNLRGSVKK